MTDDDGKQSVFPWAEVLPWLSLLRTFRLAIGPRMLLLGAMGALLMTSGWAVLAHVFSGTSDAGLADEIEAFAPAGTCPWERLIEAVPDEPSWTGWDVVAPLGHVGPQLARPFVGMLGPQVGVTGFVFWLLAALWALAVWGACGAGITRTAAVQLAAGQRLGLGAMAGHVRRKWISYVGAPLFPLLGILLATIPMLVFSLLLRNGVTLWLAALLWPLMLLGGLVMAVLLLGLAVGWPLVWPTISVECKDSFDALSRLYAYVFQRPLHYLLYVVVAAVLGVAGWILVANFAALVIHMTYWAASWGSGQERITAILEGSDSLGWGAGGAVLIRFWVGCVKLLAVGYLYSYFWTAATAIYLLLRRDTDATEMDEVCLDEEAPTYYTLPPAGTDGRGAPVVEDPAPANSAPTNGDGAPTDENGDATDGPTTDEPPPAPQV